MEMLVLLLSQLNTMQFIHIPKNAGTSIQKAINMPSVGHLTIRQITHPESAHPAKHDDFFACVRNPYDRACSLFYFSKYNLKEVHAKRKLPKSVLIPEDDNITMTEFWQLMLEKQTESKILKQQVDFLKDNNEKISNQVVHILRYENLASEWPGFAKQHGFNELSHENKSYRPHNKWRWQDEINQTIIDIVNEIYADDFEHFGYERLK